MKAIYRLLKIVFGLLAIGLVFFSAYNFGYIGGQTWAYQEEEDLRSAGLPYVLVFYAESCAVSYEVVPQLRQLEREQRNIRFLYSNVDESRELHFAHSREVRLTPTVYLYDGTGAEVAAFFGTVDVDVLNSELLRLAAGQPDQP